MQIIFMSEYNPDDYVDPRGEGKFPAAPKKCPHKDCGINLEMKKNGYYSRSLTTLTFNGRIWIRRYICSMCRKTLSALPSFCLAGFKYGVEIVISLLQQAFENGSKKKTVKEWQTRIASISRRIVNKYLSRLRNNRGLIQYGINQISPSNINIGRLPGDTDWTKSFLFGIRPNLSPEFNASFHKTTGKSFMSLHTTIAQPESK